MKELNRKFLAISYIARVHGHVYVKYIQKIKNLEKPAIYNIKITTNDLDSYYNRIIIQNYKVYTSIRINYHQIQFIFEKCIDFNDNDGLSFILNEPMLLIPLRNGDHNQIPLIFKNYFIL